MRKNINKIVALAIGISVMSGSIMPVFAADITQSTSTTNIQTQTNPKSVLTLDDAIKSAISISDTLTLDEMKISYQDKTNDITKKQDDFNNVVDDKESYDNDTADNSLNKLKQQRDFDEDILIHKVTTKYNDIVTSQMKIDEATKELEIKNNDLENSKFKASLGMTIDVDLKSSELDIQNLQNTQKSSENALKDAEYSFNVLTGKDVSKYSLEQDVKFEPLKIDGSIDEYLDNAIDSYLEYTEQLVKLNKDYYDKNYEEDNKLTTDDLTAAETAAEAAKAVGKPTLSDPTSLTAYEQYQKDTTTYNNTINNYTGILASRLTYLKTKLSNYQDETTLNENKKKFKDNLKTYYTNLLASEDKINYYKQNIEINNEKLSNLKVKYDLGMITDSAYNTQVASSEDLDLQLRSELINYNNLKEDIQKPWIAFSNNI
jgi:outer membrane protein TolC